MRLKNACAIYYPEEGRLDDLKRFLTSHAYRGGISPLHTPDEEEKKPHYHLLLTLSSPREDSSLNTEFGGHFHGLTKFQRVGSVTSYARYMYHLDQPEKQQFDGFGGGFAFGGFDFVKMTFRSIPASDYADVFSQIDACISARYPDFTYFADLVVWASAHGFSALVDFVVSHSYCVRCYLDSRNMDDCRRTDIKKSRRKLPPTPTTAATQKSEVEAEQDKIDND